MLDRCIQAADDGRTRCLLSDMDTKCVAKGRRRFPHAHAVYHMGCQSRSVFQLIVLIYLSAPAILDDAQDYRMLTLIRVQRTENAG